MGHVRQCIAQGITATIAHKGDAWGGAVIPEAQSARPGFASCRRLVTTEGRIAWLQATGGALMPSPRPTP